MIIPLKNNLKIYTVVLLALLWLGLWLFFGYNKARLIAQSRILSSNISAISQGLDFFFNDHDRFPNAVEFDNTAVMTAYLKNYPLSDFIFSGCPEILIYARPRINSYKLNICMPVEYGGYHKGWNEISIVKR